MDITFDEGRFKLAIQARKEMLFSDPMPTEREERLRLKKKVWDPKKKFLQKLANALPDQIVCFTGKPFNFPKQRGCKCRNIFVLNQQGEAAYLGTIFNRKATDVDRQRLGPDIYDSLYYSIPTHTEDIDEEQCILSAIQRCLRSFKGTSIPWLADTVIVLLSKKKGAELDQQIKDTAEQLANLDS